jgi:hypothetical protein
MYHQIVGLNQDLNLNLNSIFKSLRREKINYKLKHDIILFLRHSKKIYRNLAAKYIKLTLVSSGRGEIDKR